MLGSPVEVRYDDGGAVVLIQTDGGGPARTTDGSDGTTETPPNATHNSQGSVAGTSESSRIIIHDTHGVEGCGSITILTPTNNLKISINTKRYDRRIDGFQAAKRSLTNDLRNKLGELDELLKASCDGDDGTEPDEPSLDANLSSTVTVQTQPNASTTTTASDGMAQNGAAASAKENANVCELELQGQLYLLDDVLVRKSNDNELFHLGTVVDLEPTSHCLVRFDDTTIRRVELSRITRCGPFVQQENALHEEKLSPVRTSSPPRMLRFPSEFFPLTCLTQLPYELKSLKWDAHHRTNVNGHYCYCGNDGDWAREMVQCRRCKQWFHGRCVRSLQFPILHGDTFYVFICSICNHGHEFVRRLVLSAGNLVHLVLYNLIMRNGRRFYGLRSAILPYIEDNQRTLQLAEKFVKLSVHERAELLHNALKSNKETFCNGKDFGLSQHLWTLRQPVPPPIEPIIIPIPPEETVTESILQQKLLHTDNFRFLPRKNYFMDGATRERMLGLAYANHPESVEDPRTESYTYCTNLPSTSATVTSKQSTKTETSSSSPQPSQVAPACNGTVSLVRAYRRKRYGIRPTPVGTPIAGGGVLDTIIPPPPNFHGANNPFYEEESISLAMMGRARNIERKMGTMKRRACDINHRCMVNAKRRNIRYTGNSSLRGAVPKTRAFRGRKRTLSDVAEESRNALSWHNVQRHNMNGYGTAYGQRPSSATCSSSSCHVEQVDATVAAGGEQQENSDASCIEEKPLASGRRSSGRLIALRPKNYSDSRRYKRRRDSETGVMPCHHSDAYDGTETDQSNGDRLSCSGFTSSRSLSSSCLLRNAYWEQDTGNNSSDSRQQQQQQDRARCVVVGKRTLPDGTQELLLEEN
uniref:Zinc finger PHD-type domain-containing protein n=1 Tax=Anopheles funestus TaxID=62324 RepID=A0A182RPA0_ANOFN